MKKIMRLNKMTIANIKIRRKEENKNNMVKYYSTCGDCCFMESDLDTIHKFTREIK